MQMRVILSDVTVSMRASSTMYGNGSRSVRRVKLPTSWAPGPCDSRTLLRTQTRTQFVTPITCGLVTSQALCFFMPYSASRIP